IPIFTFVNKCDRVGEDPLRLLDDVAADLGIRCFPVTWPITEGGRLVGVYDRLEERIHLFERTGDHGQTRVEAKEGGLDDPALVELLGEEAHARLLEESELLELAGAEWSEEAFRAGDLSPAFFGSALTNFGVEPFLRRFLTLAPGPQPREAAEGSSVEPDDERFTGFVFKIQANMDPKHRDRIAFVRICSGRFEPGMVVKNARTAEDVRLAAPKRFFGRERQTVAEAWAGDVIGVHDRGALHIGDTLAEDGGVAYGGIPRFSPEHFSRVRVPDPLRRKHLDTGLRQLSEEGAAQVFYPEREGGREPIVGAVGVLQFDVLLHRLEHEYGVNATLERLPFTRARWAEGEADAVRRAAEGYGRRLVYDSKGRPLVLFESDYVMRMAEEKAEGVSFHDVAQ
ncbi:MAG: EF-Tu/IF-2/RF-3 family GTPase, partial [Gemmatimonadota bacterium]